MTEKAASKPTVLPFSALYPFVGGALTGIALRIAFSGAPDDIFTAMSGAFIYLAPMLVGTFTVYVAERRKRRSWAYYFFAPFVANALFVLGTMIILIEGMICAAIILPLFGVLGGVSGLIMGAIVRLTNWPKQTVYAFAVLPFIVASLESGVPLPDRVAAIERTVVVNAKPADVWRQILDAQSIDSAELENAWLFRIGVPLPLAGTTHSTATGTERRVTMGKKIYFDEVFTDLQEHQYIRWTYRYYADSFPRFALDEHVVIGGSYFDLKDTSYTLAQREGKTVLTVRMQYRVSTRFNWYADPLAQFLMGNLAQSNLEFYRHRSEAQPKVGPNSAGSNSRSG